MYQNFKNPIREKTKEDPESIMRLMYRNKVRKKEGYVWFDGNYTELINLK